MTASRGEQPQPVREALPTTGPGRNRRAFADFLLVLPLLVPLSLLWRPVAWWGWLAAGFGLLAPTWLLLAPAARHARPHVWLQQDELVIERGSQTRRLRPDELARVLELRSGSLAVQLLDGELERVPVVLRPPHREPTGARLADWHRSFAPTSEPTIVAPLRIPLALVVLQSLNAIAVGGVMAAVSGRPAMGVMGPCLVLGNLLLALVLGHPRVAFDWTDHQLTERPGIAGLEPPA